MLHMSFRTAGRPMKALLLGVLVAHLGYYMILPILPIYFKQTKAMGISEIGLILAISSFSFQAASVIGGFLADRIGRRTMITLGAIIRAGAFLGFALSQSSWVLMVMAFANGLGGGFNAPTTKAAIAALASDEHKTTAFSLRGIAANIGTCIAGIMAYFVLGGASSLIFFAAAGLYVILGIISFLYVPKNCGEKPCPIVSPKSYIKIFKNKAFVIFSLISVLIWAVYTQFSLSVPLRAAAVLPDPSIVSLIWTINSFIVIIFQAPISSWVLKKIHPLYSLSLGTLFIGGGLSSLYWATNFTWFTVSGVIFIIGEMLMMPTMDSITSRLATANMIGVFFGLANFISGLGEGAGNYVGGQLLSFDAASLIPWTVYAISSGIISLMLMSLRFWIPIGLALGDEYGESTNSIKSWFMKQKQGTK